MAQTLETIIAINATVGNGFSAIGSTLTQLGAQIDGISEKLIGFGKDSAKTYQDYEKNMSEARVALSTLYGKDTAELNQVMKNLDTSAKEWASTTIFHTDDVGNAITEAARAGWDYNQIMTGIPAAMELAQAGSLDLSSAIYYITEAAKAGGIAFDDLGGFIDMWAYTANSSNGSIESFGETMLKLGSVMQFTGSREELLSLIAIMHDTGTEGSTAATLMRTAMMNILAPSGTAGKVLEQLGATDEEIRSIREDASKIQALEILGEHGFSAFDAQGQAKPILTIFRDLREALGEISGGYDQIDKNETTLGVLGAVFGKRGITGALNIMNMMERAEELQTELLSGNASEYGEYAAGTMMDTLYGRMETWESKVENLELRTGEALAAQLEPALEFAGGIVDSLANLDTGTFNALVSGLEVIAMAGPGLLATGAAFRFIGYAMTPAGYFGLGVIALVAAAAAINELEKADFAGKFGNLELDSSQIQTYVQTISDEFKQAYTNVDEFKRALGEAVTQYQTTTSAFKSNILTDMLTGVEIKEGSDEYNKLVGMGETIIAAVRSGIENNYAGMMESVTQTFGGKEETITNPVWAQIISILEQGYEEELDRAEALGQQLRNAMTSAFADGHLTGEEVANIQSIIDEENALLAQQQDRAHYLERQRILRKAQTLGLDAIREASEQIETERNAEWETLQDRQAADYYDTATWYDRAIENGWMVPNTDGTAGEHAATQADKDAALAELYQRQEDERYRWGAEFSDFLMGVWTEGITSSDLNGTWEAMNRLAQDFREAGGIMTQDAVNRYTQNMGSFRESLQAQEYMQEMVAALGGFDVLQGYVDYFLSKGDMDMAMRYQRVMDIYDAMGRVTHVTPEAGMQGVNDYSLITGSYGQIDALLRGTYGEGSAIIDAEAVKRNAITPETLYQYMLEQRGFGLEPDWQTYLGEDLWSQLNAVAQASGTNISDMIARAMPVEQDIDTLRDTLEQARANYLGAYALEDQAMRDQVLPDYRSAYIQAGADYVRAGIGQDVGVIAYANTQELETSIQAEDGQELLAYVNGDATDLHMSIMNEDGQTIITEVTGDTTALRSAIEGIRSEYAGQTLRMRISGTNLFAEGGRATEASIFGEGDTAEWAIPEEHTERTAELLNAARQASGFTWPDLLARFGGLNANPRNAPTTLVYSPTIYAQDATDLEAKLDADKARLEKWYTEKQMIDKAVVYE